MPPHLGAQYSPTWAGNPPHMATRDLALWQRALPKLAPRVRWWHYDAAVGDGSGPPADPTDATAVGFWWSSRKRIDAVGFCGDHWLLVEVRPNAGLGALGAIQTYRSLWERDPPDTLPVVGMIVSDRAEPDVIRTALNAGLFWLLV